MPSPLATALAGPSGAPPGDKSWIPTAGASNIDNFGGGRFQPWATRSPGSPATSWAGQQSSPSAPNQPPTPQPGQPGQLWQQNGQPGGIAGPPQGQPGMIGSIFGGRGGGNLGMGGGGHPQPPVPAGAMPTGQMPVRPGFGAGAAGGGIAALGRGIVPGYAKGGYVASPQLIHAITQAESSGNPNAVGPVTSSGERATGLMQLMPGTAAEMAKKLGMPSYDLTNAADNTRLGTAYLDQLGDQFGGNVSQIAAAYNAGPGRVMSGGPLPAETQNYVQKIMASMGQGMPAPPAAAIGGGSASDRLNMGQAYQASANRIAASPVPYNAPMAAQTVAPFNPAPVKPMPSAFAGTRQAAQFTGGNPGLSGSFAGAQNNQGNGGVQSGANAAPGANVGPGYHDTGTNSAGFAKGGMVENPEANRPWKDRRIYDPNTGWTVQYGGPGDTPGEPYSHQQLLGTRTSFMAGGDIPGDPRVGDTMQINTTPGEYVINRASAHAAGPALLNAINDPSMAAKIRALIASRGGSRFNGNGAAGGGIAAVGRGMSGRH